MIDKLIQYFKDKKVLILGFGKEGQSTYHLIRKYFQEKKIYIADKKENLVEQFSFLKFDKNIEIINPDNYLDNLNEYDVIMKSPGISFAGMDISKFKTKIKSQLELFLECFDVFTIGITGTKGKSTTSTLIYHVLKEQNKKTMLLGNIGIPVFDYINEIEKDTTIVLEMSSHQLEFMEVSPNIAILLNIFEEHLDHYDSFEKYIDSKLNIFKYQKSSDYFLYNIDNEILKKYVNNIKATLYMVSIKKYEKGNIILNGDTVFVNGKAIYNKNKKRNLVGDYNLNNIMFVLGVSEILKLDIHKTINTISNFKTLEHRLELVGTYDNIIYYDNSIATIPIATIEAIEALKNVDTLIIGGMDRGIDYSEFIEYLNNSNINNIICMPKTGHDIAKKLKIEKRYIVDNLEQAVDIAKQNTRKRKNMFIITCCCKLWFF